MDAIRVSKVVEQVLFTKAGSVSEGTIHLTAHHVIFRYNDSEQKEMWMPYPLISLVNRRPQNLQGQSQINFQTRTFESFSLTFQMDSEASDVFESVKELTVATSVTQLYAFFYTPNPPLPTNEGWTIYSPRDEYGRMGVGTRSKAWRFTDLNKEYTFCPTYPARLVVPTRISDTTLQYASKYRSKCRIPILSYLHWGNYGSITRSSQPMVGITQNRSVQDEKLIEAIFQSHWSPDSRVSSAPVYGATPTNLIIDARPTVNAVANTAKGAGTENMDYYKEGKKVYLGIDHIHTMRESLAKVVEALKEADQLLASINNDFPEQLPRLAVLDKQALRRSGWLRHISAILEGTLIITKNVHVNSSHVLIHCSDGWDRTSQLSALSQLCLDPFYRTIRGFEVLIEKDWLSFGHRFLDRCGHLSSDKFFLSTTGDSGSGSGAEAAQAFFSSVQNRFASQHHIKETSPIFHQFLESVRQIQRQYPERFEFNERFLRQLYYHLYSCQFGTFLFNCERERKAGDGTGPPPVERTISVWDFFNSSAEMIQNTNPAYNPSLDDPMKRTEGADMGVLLPNPKDVRFWHELYGRSDDEMNGKFVPVQTRDIELLGPVDGGDEDPVLQQAAAESFQGSPSKPSTLVEKVSNSLNVAPTSGRKSSFGANLRDLSSSLPELNPSRPGPSRSRTPTPSSVTQARAPMAQSPAVSSPNTPIWSRAVPPEILSGGGVKSVWGKLSSNASAAFSVVQDAYAGVAKDLRNVSNSSEEATSERTSELRGRELLSDWGRDRSRSPQPSTQPPPLTMTNPWSATSTKPSSSRHISLLEENPWGSSTDAEPNYATRTVFSTLEPTSPLPLDPTIESILTQPRKMTGPSYERSSPRPDARRSSQQAPLPIPPKNDSNTDPLGVGLL
ncbi:protein phosphatase [Gymnopilus junonius]|uniref:Protein phosphatase n=1 Tax=Gymnopilus junonius TaxID=109634 RepID=A0A9P5P102_GYMJU|nr:protein phosphatase [Gymnopilus junonius]